MTRILLYNIPAEKAGLIRIAAYRLGLSCVSVPPEDFGRALGDLLGLPGYAADSEAEPFADEMLVMEELSSGLLDELRRLGATVPLKAVVTEHNVSWSASRLCREVRAEHEAMQRLRPKAPQNRHPHKKRK